MPWEPPEPTTDTILPPTTTDSSQTAPAAAAGAGEAATGDVGAASEPQPIDLDSEEGLRAAIERSALLRGRLEKAQGDGFNAGKQNRDAELRRDQGSSERAQAYQQYLSQKYGIELDDADAKAAPLFVKANEDFTRVGLSRVWAQATLQQAGETELSPELTTALDALEASNDVAGAQAVASTAIQRALIKKGEQVIATLTPEQLQALPKTHPIHAWVEKTIEDRVAEELRAREIETVQAGRTNPPRVAGTSPGGAMTPEMARTITPQQAANLSDEDYANWKEAFFAASAA